MVNTWSLYVYAKFFCLIFVHKDPSPPVEAFLITAYSSPVNNPATEKLRRTVARSNNTPVLGSATTEDTSRIQCRAGKENDSSISTSKKSKANESGISISKKSKALSCSGMENYTVSTPPSVGKENGPVITSRKASFFIEKENVTTDPSKRSKASSELLCTSESPNKKRKLVLIIILVYFYINSFS